MSNGVTGGNFIMKKFLSTLVATMLAMSMVACDSAENSNDSSKTDVSSQTQSSEITTITTKATTTTEATTTTITTTQVTSDIPAKTESVTNSSEYVNFIGEKISITDITVMAADLIEAVDGTSFKVNGNKFEVYHFADGSAKLTEAASGTLTYNVEGFGEFTLTAIVNGNYVMIFNTPDENVSNAFSSIDL